MTKEGLELAGSWRRFMVFLGLADDEEPTQYPDEMPVSAELDSSIPTEPPPLRESPPRIRTLDPSEPAPRGAVVRQINQQPADKLHVVAPGSYNEAREIGDQLKRGVPVIINLGDADRDLRRRLVDFTSGLVYALGGKMERVAENIFLVTPSNVEVSAEARRRMKERGLFSGV